MTYDPPQKTDYEAQAVKRLLEQYQKPFLRALVRIFSRRVQERENATWEVIRYRLYDAAEGVQLSTFASILDVKQGSLTDAQFKREIAVKFLILRSQGDPNTIEKVSSLALAPGVPYAYADEEIATIRIDVLAVLSLADSDHAYRLIQATRQGGVRLIFTVGVDSGAGEGYARAFTFADCDSAAALVPSVGFSDQQASPAGGFLLQEYSTS